ncbi:MAG: hypothetical protein IPP22_06745 [Nitrosomonas sp.]|nr:hypothetical protein [Nitrosomonas sp.]
MRKSTSKIKIIPAILLVLILGACNVAKPKPTIQIIHKTIEQHKESLLEYAANILDASEDAQKKNCLSLQELSSNNQEIDTRMKLALLYGLPGSKVKNSNEAQVLLDDIIQEPLLDIEHKMLANLLHDYIVDTRKLSRQAKDEKERFNRLQIKAETVQQKADYLQRKLDELMAIEKTITDRDQGNN